MESLAAFSELNNRKLWYDGDNTVNTTFLYNKLLDGRDISSYFVEDITPEIKQYNRYNEKKLQIKGALNNITNEWNIPDIYKNITLKSYILSKLDKEIDASTFSDDEIETRITRVNIELGLWVEHELELFLKTLIYITESFDVNNVVWGVGRGSSCCCYILYLIGIHNVDSVLYNLELSDFFKEYKK